MAYIYGINKDTDVSLRKICLRSMINTTYVAADYSNLAYQIVKHYHGHINVDLCFMILDCCCEHTFYINHFGLLTKELCQINEKFVDIVEITFIHCYIESDSFDSHKSNIIAIYFAHLSRLNLIPFKLTAILGKKSIYPNTSYFKIFKNLTYI
ncbi:PREDICTED: pre-mRNA-splicing factor CWC22 homolog [Diuraphis noxia]|uniref:pre-mRNA-splicing factor CWC22 homolog n=1 Tax=Diuraphis noxia TaxID=143948 RepID=UPI000763B62B|nr:PREDICTED: pre-mRNA-splicing factor CWC22 homolog [Diuraphis noxia]